MCFLELYNEYLKAVQLAFWLEFRAGSDTYTVEIMDVASVTSPIGF